MRELLVFNSEAIAVHLQRKGNLQLGSPPPRHSISSARPSTNYQRHSGLVGLKVFLWPWHPLSKYNLLILSECVNREKQTCWVKAPLHVLRALSPLSQRGVGTCGGGAVMGLWLPHGKSSNETMVCVCVCLRQRERRREGGPL